MRLSGKVALIVGAGGGMGSSVPYLFAREGANVVLGARTQEPLEALAARIRPHLPHGSGEIGWATGDALTAAGCAALVSGATDHFGKLDVLYCNVGDAAFRNRSIEEIDEEAWRYLIDINLTSGFNLVRAAVPALRATGGTVIIVAAAAVVRREASPGYAAAKAGLLALTTSLAKRLRPDGVRVNCICPGSIGPSRADEDFAEPAAALVRAPMPSDVGYAAVYFASNESAWVTGQFLEIEGGAGL